MSDRTIVIKISNEKISFNPDLSISIRQTNIPFEHLTFRSNCEIFWKAEMLEYSSADKSLKLKIIDYSAQDQASFKNQIPKKEIQRLLFDKFDWTKLEKTAYILSENKITGSN